MRYGIGKPINMTAIAMVGKLAGIRLMARGWIGKRFGLIWCWFEPGPKPRDRIRRKRT